MKYLGEKLYGAVSIAQVGHIPTEPKMRKIIFDNVVIPVYNSNRIMEIIEVQTKKDFEWEFIQYFL